MVVLDESNSVPDDCFKGMLIEAFKEKTTLVAEHFRFEEEYVTNGECRRFHVCFSVAALCI